MTSWLRSTLRLIRLLLVLAAVLIPCGTATAYGPEAASPDLTGPSASAEPSRAGSRPAEGRPRPGRPDGPAARTEGVDDPADPDYPDETESEDGVDDASPSTTAPWGHHGDDYDAATPTASESTQQAGLAPSALPPTEAAAQGRASGSDPSLRLLPLGSGMVLIGLGLALVGLRVRHD
ncbi:hypothetical protein ACQEV4_03910 [Streptomyces shenzhenensis]|uniref:hypothetical protein n=1 Tax=Streptomyces shenzhenensis TaxID=943815 RepID=UPI003D8E549A